MRIYSFLIWLMANLWSITIAVADPIMTDDPLLSDPDILASLEILMGMSPEEKEGAIADVGRLREAVLVFVESDEDDEDKEEAEDSKEKEGDEE